MLNRLDSIKKNKLLVPAFVLGLLLCWFLAFNKTFDAIKLNRKLKDTSEKEHDISFNSSYVKQKLSALDLILKGYKVKEDWNDQLWMQASSIAARKNVPIEFTFNKPVLNADSTLVGNKQSLYFKGGFIELLKLVDTLERVNGIGQISALQLKTTKKDIAIDRIKKCVLRLDFRGME